MVNDYKNLIFFQPLFPYYIVKEVVKDLVSFTNYYYQKFYIKYIDNSHVDRCLNCNRFTDERIDCYDKNNIIYINRRQICMDCECNICTTCAANIFGNICIGCEAKTKTELQNK